MFNLLAILLLPLIGAINQASFKEVLSHDEEASLINRLANNDIEARNLLIEHNLRLVAHIVKKYENSKVEKDDLISIGSFGLIKAVDTFKKDNGTKLATYASRCIENEILMYLRSIKKSKDTISIYQSIGEDKDGNEIRLCDIIEDPASRMSDVLIEQEYQQKLKKALEQLDIRELDIICRRYGLNNYKIETQKEIANSLNISRSYVSRIEKRALTKLSIYLKNHL